MVLGPTWKGTKIGPATLHIRKDARCGHPNFLTAKRRLKIGLPAQSA